MDHEILKELDYLKKPTSELSQQSNALKDKMKQAFSKKLLQDQSIMNQLQGEFSVVKGYGNEQAAALFAVTGANKAKNGDHYLYSISVSI